MAVNLLFALLVFVLSALAAGSDWYRTASFYQIYPQTFLDGGGGSREGFGTFRGIQQKLPYLKDLGIDCLWLTPVFESAFNAFGYDITDYEALDMRYGTRDDFRSLVDAIHAADMRIIVDFVPNHCSAQHEFFQRSIARDPVYDEWFVWAEGRGADKREPPSNWQRIGGGLASAWTFHPERNEFSYAQFSGNMPDLNLRSAAVRAYWEKFLRLWLDFGLDGFRVDAISHGFEFSFANGTRPNEPVVPGVTEETDFGYLDHIYTQDQPELFELIYEWRSLMDTYDDRVRIFMTESYSQPKTIMKFYRSEDGKKAGAHLPFNFQLIRMIRRNSTADTFVDTINEWFALLPAGEVTNWAIGNHDQSRVATKYGIERVDIFNTLCTMLPGTSVTYYGEEIGMEDSCVFYDADHNQPGHRCNTTYRPITDAPFRTPMQWSSALNGGFTNSSKPWLPIGDKYETVNVEAQLGVAGSHLEIYRSLQTMRKHKAISEGSLDGFKIVKLGENSFGFKRELNDTQEQSVLVLLNYGSVSETVKLEELALVGTPTLVTWKIVGWNSERKVDEQTDIGGNLTLSGYEALVGVYNNARGMASGKVFIFFSCAFVAMLRVFN